jgi:6-phosphogluconolactonase
VPKFAYTANSASSNISAYTVNAITGALAAVPGSPFKSGNSPLSISVDPSGRFAYVSSKGSSTSDPPVVWGYTIDPTSGVLAPVTGGPFAAGAIPISITVDPSGRFAYEGAYGANTIVGYSINANTGALSMLPSGPIASGAGPYAVTLDPSGKFLYSANQTSGDVWAYKVDPGTGALTNIGAFTAGSSPSSITVDPSGRFVYVGYLPPSPTIPSGVSAFAINASTGELTPVSGTPFSLGTSALSISIEPTGRFFYGAGYYSSTIAAAGIDPTTGALAALSGGPFPSTSLPYFVSTDPSGKFVYSADGDSTSNVIAGYTIDAVTGALTPISGSPFTFSGEGLASMAVWGTPQ